MKPYLINLNDPSDCLGKFVDEDRDRNFTKEHLTLLLTITGPEEIHEVTRSVFYKNNEISNHMQRFGFETMFVRGGEIEVTVRGKKCRVTDGDILHFGCYNAHRMVWLEDTPWLGFFHNMNICQPMADKMLVNENYPDMTEAEIAEIYRESYDCCYLAPPIAAEVPKSEVSEVRTPEFAFATFTFDGLEMRQKVGRWETDGMYEIWEFNMEDGFRAGCGEPNPKNCIYYVKEGNVRFRVFNKEFVAPKDSIVHIPPYATHSFQSDGKSVMYDTYSSTMYFDLISEWKSYEANEPEKLQDKAFIDSLKKKYNCCITEWGRR
jgi:quercetin dioxygenase-like cupin family protein